MDKAQMTDRLGSLIQMEQDAVSAYNQILERVDDQDIKSHFAFFIDQHNLQIHHLKQAIGGLGGYASQGGHGTLSGNFKGMGSVGHTGGTEAPPVDWKGGPAGSSGAFDNLANISDKRQLVERLLNGEKKLLSSYDKALKELDDLSMDTKAMLFDNCKKDRDKVDYLEKALLDGSIWNKEC